MTVTLCGNSEEYHCDSASPPRPCPKEKCAKHYDIFYLLRDIVFFISGKINKKANWKQGRKMNTVNLL